LAPLVARASNPAGQGRAHEFIKIGDERFRRQRFNEAYQRYKDAATAAPDLSEVHFRQGLALAAMGQYAQGVRAIKRGLQIEAAWPSSKFQLDELWDRNRVAKDAIRDALAEAAIARPQDGDLMFLLGLHLFFDGQRERSQLFFDRAEVLDPGAAEHVRAFLRELAKGPPVVIPAGPRAI
jgi:tetratricopeptide (TPR) repeat protein